MPFCLRNADVISVTVLKTKVGLNSISNSPHNEKASREKTARPHC